MAKKMVVNKAEALKLFKLINFPTAKGWNDDRMVTKLNKMASLVNDELVAKVKKKDKAIGALLQKILNALENDQEVVLATSGAPSKSSKAASSKKGKKARVEDEEGDDEEEDEEDEEDDEEDEEDDEDEEGDEDEEEEDLKEEEDEEDEEEEDEDEDSDEEEEDEDEDSDEDEEEDSEDEEEDEDESDEEEEEDSDEDEDEDEEDEEVETKKGKKGKVTAKSGKKGKGAKAPPKKAGKAGGPGVIGSIIEFLTNATDKKPLTKKIILEKLKKRFPDRAGESMWTTINIQVPNRIKVTKGITITKNDKGYFIDPKKNAKALKALKKAE